jgi:hypothetical protein
MRETLLCSSTIAIGIHLMASVEDLPIAFSGGQTTRIRPMNTNPLQESPIIIHGAGIGSTTRGMVRERAAELAAINGRRPHEVTPTDWDDAQRELTGGPPLVGQQALLVRAPESDRWNPIPRSIEHEAPVSFDDNEDEDGRSLGERLSEERVMEAAHD